MKLRAPVLFTSSNRLGKSMYVVAEQGNTLFLNDLVLTIEYFPSSANNRLIEAHELRPRSMGSLLCEYHLPPDYVPSKKYRGMGVCWKLPKVIDYLLQAKPTTAGIKQMCLHILVSDQSLRTHFVSKLCFSFSPVAIRIRPSSFRRLSDKETNESCEFLNL